MGSEINKIRDLKRVRVRGYDDSLGADDLPLDHRLTFSPSKDETWQFDGGHIYLNGSEINELTKTTGNDVGSLCGLSTALDQYRQHVWNKAGRSNGKFNGAINAMLEKILCRLGSIYDGLFKGLRFEYSNGDFWINNINIHSVLKLYRLRPTNSARCYLVGLRNKLGLILSSQNGSPHYDGVMREAEQLFGEISCALDQIPTNDGGRTLPAHGAS